jgi:hypothetical protein
MKKRQNDLGSVMSRLEQVRSFALVRYQRTKGRYLGRHASAPFVLLLDVHLVEDSVAVVRLVPEYGLTWRVFEQKDNS